MATDMARHQVMQEATFIAAFGIIANRIHATAREKGWWDNERNDAEMIALMHSELSEALEGLRDGNPPSDKIGPEFSQVEEEFADVIIRMMDNAAGRGYRVAEALVAKLEYNAGRERMHGGRKF